jgi:hypothetical protein
VQGAPRRVHAAQCVADLGQGDVVAHGFTSRALSIASAIS